MEMATATMDQFTALAAPPASNDSSVDAEPFMRD